MGGCQSDNKKTREDVPVPVDMDAGDKTPLLPPKEEQAQQEAAGPAEDGDVNEGSVPEEKSAHAAAPDTSEKAALEEDGTVLVSEEEFVTYCREVYQQMDEDGASKIEAEKMDRVKAAMQTEVDRMASSSCLAMPLPARFSDFVFSQHIVLNIFYGTGYPKDTSKWYHRLGLLLLMLLLNLIMNILSSVKLHAHNVSYQIVVVLILDVSTCGIIRQSFLEAFNGEWSEGAARCFLAFLIIMIIAEMWLVFLAFYLSEGDLTVLALEAWITCWVAARITEVFKLGFTWGLRTEYGHPNGAC